MEIINFLTEPNLLGRLTENLFSEFGTNEFLVGTTIPFILAGVFLAIRKFFSWLGGLFSRYFIFEIRVNSTTRYFEEINEFVFEKYIWGFFRRRFVISYLWNKSKMAMTSGYGSSIAIAEGSIGYVSLTSEESDSEEFKEYLTIRAFSFRPNAASERVYKAIGECISNLDDSDSISVIRQTKDDYSNVKKPKRSIDSVFVPKETKSKLLNSLDKFVESESTYIEKGIPYHLGIMLHGPPGTGKTSLIHALASYTERDIVYSEAISLSSLEFNAKDCILVLEDFDSGSLSVGKRSSDDDEDEKDDIRKVKPISDTLNYLDGFLTPHGLIVIATTNHLEHIDPAVVRPGRFDILVEIGLMKKAEYLEMCDFYGVEPDNTYTPESGAAVMGKVKEKMAKI